MNVHYFKCKIRSEIIDIAISKYCKKKTQNKSDHHNLHIIILINLMHDHIYTCTFIELSNVQRSVTHIQPLVDHDFNP